MQDAEVIEKENLNSIKGGITAAELLAAIAENGIDRYAGLTYNFGGSGGSDATSISLNQSGWANIGNTVNSYTGGGYGIGVSLYNQYATDPSGNLYGGQKGSDTWNTLKDLNTVTVTGTKSSSNNNFLTWGYGFQNLENYATLAEMGAYGANNLRAARAFGELGLLATLGNIALDTYELKNYYQNGEGGMDGIRFGIRTGGTAWGILEGSLVGGPEGLFVGVVAAGGVWAGEQMLDATQNWIQQISQGCADFENAVSNRGWIPGYN